jgi:hypothetical protein
MIQSETMRFLFDPLTGGPPRAYECKLCPDAKISDVELGRITAIKVYPRTVTKSLRGMRMHQKLIHGFEPQGKLPIEEETDEPTSVVRG